VVDHKIRKLYFLEGARDPLELQWKQQGGGKNEAQGMVEVDGKRYVYTYTVTKDETKYAVYRKKGRHCFIMYLFDDEECKGKKMAVLESLDQFTDCSLDNGATGKQLLLAAIQILRGRKDVSYVDLNDKSGKNLPNGKRIPLADMYFVCTGKTWYGSILPLTPQDPVLFDDSLYKVQTKTWDELYHCLQTKIPGFMIPVPTTGINTTEPGSAMKVFQRIKDAKTDFFADYMSYIIACIGYSSMKGSGWRYTF
jgi:hypothetical protein